MTDVVSNLHPARWWHTLDDGRIQCDLCPRDCKLHEGQRGACFVRQMSGGEMVLTTYGRSSGFCIDPVEKKPLNQFYPGSSILSFGTAGCNLACKFCQNWDISKSRDMDRLADAASPRQLARAAKQSGCKSVAFTYNDPVIFAEYAMDVADACHEEGILTVAVTAGYIHDAPRREFYARMDAANVDLKGFTDGFYVKLCGAHLQPVLDTLAYLKHETEVWFEITTLLIPGWNDSDDEIRAESKWVMKELGPDVPLHFTAFHPDWKMTDVPGTPPKTLSRARRIALDE
ncbi:MAG TPA: AmmeMemoRadiSam system radical SAM enzyme, partial [Burkholderiales bacterium]